MLKKTKAVVALGEFDGVHLAHRALLAQTRALAKQLDAAPVAFTFANHPSSAFGDEVQLLNTVQEKQQLIKSCGCRCDLVQFDLQFAALTAQEFIMLLQETYELVGAVCGYNYFFGNKARGDGALLRQLGAQYGFAVRIVEEVCYDDAPVCSTRIRQAIASGEIRQANAMLGYDFFYSGQVFSHNKLGTSLGYPTANLLVDKIHPKYGVYSARLLHRGNAYRSVAFMGVRQTLGETQPILEIHAIDQALDLYDQTIQVVLLDYLRGEVKFDSVYALQQQIQRDVQRTLLLQGRYVQ